MHWKFWERGRDTQHDDLLSSEITLQRHYESSRKNPPASSRLIDTGLHGAIWEVPIPDREPVYMRLDRSADETSYAVHVDTELFYYYWLLTSRRTSYHKCPPRQKMPLDRKYDQAVEGFDAGRKSPVPLARPHLHIREGLVSLLFTNGLTRSMWLIANRAPSFPVEVSSLVEAQLFQHILGTNEPPIELQDRSGLFLDDNEVHIAGRS